MIETQRLILIPLTHVQLLQYRNADPALEESLGVTPVQREMSPELLDALDNTILPNVADPQQDYLYGTLWAAILKTDRIVIGDLCFVGPPNDAGEIEIGYGTYEAYRGKGLMREAVGGMVKWAQQQTPVKAVIASTDRTNEASSRILQRNGFLPAGATGDLLHWRLDFGDGALP